MTDVGVTLCSISESSSSVGILVSYFSSSSSLQLSGFWLRDFSYSEFSSSIRSLSNSCSSGSASILYLGSSTAYMGFSCFPLALGLRSGYCAQNLFISSSQIRLDFKQFVMQGIFYSQTIDFHRLPISSANCLFVRPGRRSVGGVLRIACRKRKQGDMGNFGFKAYRLSRFIWFFNVFLSFFLFSVSLSFFLNCYSRYFRSRSSFFSYFFSSFAFFFGFSDFGNFESFIFELSCQSEVNPVFCFPAGFLPSSQFMWLSSQSHLAINQSVFLMRSWRWNDLVDSIALYLLALIQKVWFLISFKKLDV